MYSKKYYSKLTAVFRKETNNYLTIRPQSAGDGRSGAWAGNVLKIN
jgi:hypothetical protein